MLYIQFEVVPKGIACDDGTTLITLSKYNTTGQKHAPKETRRHIDTNNNDTIVIFHIALK